MRRYKAALKDDKVGGCSCVVDGEQIVTKEQVCSVTWFRFTSGGWRPNTKNMWKPNQSLKYNPYDREYSTLVSMACTSIHCWKSTCFTWATYGGDPDWKQKNSSLRHCQVHVCAGEKASDLRWFTQSPHLLFLASQVSILPRCHAFHY